MIFTKFHNCYGTFFIFYKMKLASLRNQEPDGELVVVSRDLSMMARVPNICRNLITAIEHWDEISPMLEDVYLQLNQGICENSCEFDPRSCTAPLPRAPQWCDASAFLNHARLMAKAFNHEPHTDADKLPLMYQGASDDFLGAYDDVPFVSEDDGIDFEGEFGVITSDVPMGIDAKNALSKIKLIVQINDWSLHSIGQREMGTGFGFLQAKPSTSFAPIAITPDELDEEWIDGRLDLELRVEWNGKKIGKTQAKDMHFGFGDLIAHACKTRRIKAGTIIGSGTISNAQKDFGASCIAEIRALEIIEYGKAITEYMKYSDTIKMEAWSKKLNFAPFGEINQKIFKYTCTP